MAIAYFGKTARTQPRQGLEQFYKFIVMLQGEGMDFLKGMALGAITIGETRRSKFVLNHF